MQQSMPSSALFARGLSDSTACEVMKQMALVHKLAGNIVRGHA